MNFNEAMQMLGTKLQGKYGHLGFKYKKSDKTLTRHSKNFTYMIAFSSFGGNTKDSISIEHFSQKYRYADEAEALKIETFISKLNFKQPGQLAIQEVCPYPHGNAYLCFLMGTDALFEIYVFGKYPDIMSDHDAWEVFSPYLLLVDEDFIHYTYINDNGEVLESRVS